MKRNNFLPTLVLSAICLAVALILALINSVTAPLIKEAQDKAAMEALLEVLPEGSNFEELSIDKSYPNAVTKGYRADGGFVFQMKVTGFKSGLVIMCGIDEDGKIVGVKHLQTAETYGFEEELNNAYIGDSNESLELILATGATSKSKTSLAYYEAIKAALEAYNIASAIATDTSYEGGNG